MYQEAVCVNICYRDRTEADFQLGQMELPTLPQKDAYRIRLAYGTVLFTAFDWNFYVLDLVTGAKSIKFTVPEVVQGVIPDAVCHREK